MARKITDCEQTLIFIWKDIFGKADGGEKETRLKKKRGGGKVSWPTRRKFKWFETFRVGGAQLAAPKLRTTIEQTIFQLVLNEPGSRRLRRIAGRLPAALDPALAPELRANPATFLGSRTALILNGATFTLVGSMCTDTRGCSFVFHAAVRVHAMRLRALTRWYSMAVLPCTFRFAISRVDCSGLNIDWKVLVVFTGYKPGFHRGKYCNCRAKYKFPIRQSFMQWVLWYKIKC